MIFLVTALSFAAILIALAVLLLLAERYLANYGACKVSVNGGEQTLDVAGGRTLLNTLLDEKVFIPSACGGKGSCGYCKCQVLKGGGPVLPTEKPYLSRVELRRGLRLACQVKVKEDMDIAIPDFLETVRSMIRNKTYNARLRWLWRTTSEPVAEPPAPAVVHGAHEQDLVVQSIVARHRERRGSIVPLLQDVNSAFNYLPEWALRRVSHELATPLSEIHRIATFYNAFSLTPRGRNVIKVCLGTACYVKRGEKLLETVEQKLGIKVNQCTPDGAFSIETVSCIGCCGQAPSLVINDEIYGYLRPDMIDGILDKYAPQGAGV